MSSKRHEVDTPNLWFPKRFAEQTILIRYSRRGRALEISALGVGGDLGGATFRISLADFLSGLDVPSEHIAEAFEGQP